MKYLLFCFYLILSLIGSAQNYIVDQYVYGGDWSDQPVKIIQANNNLFVLFVLGSGNGSGNLNFDAIECGGFSTLVLCLDEAGNNLWQSVLCGNSGDTPTDMIDVGDGIVICMSSSSSPGTGNKTSELFTNQQFPFTDYWIVKIDYDGNIIWQKSFGSFQSDFPKSLTLTSEGKILITGYSAITDGGFTVNTSGNKTAPNKGLTDLWIILIDENGNEIWQKTFGINDPNQSHLSIFGGEVLPNGNFLIFGRSSFLGISGDKSIESFGANGWLICLDEDGNKLWDKIYGGNPGENINGGVLVNDNRIFLFLESYSGISGNRTVEIKGMQDILIYKLDLNGNILEQTCFGTEGNNEFYSAYLHQDKILLCARPDSDLPSIDKTEPSRGGMDYWIISFDKETLELVNEKTYGGTGQDLIRSVVFFNEHLYITGFSGSGIGGDKTVPNFGLGNAWILKINPTQLLYKEEHFLFETTIYPNPTTSQINITFNEATQLKKAFLHDVSGKVVLEQTFDNNFENVYAFNLSGFASGIYTLRLEGDGFVVTRQVVVD